MHVFKIFFLPFFFCMLLKDKLDPPPHPPLHFGLSRFLICVSGPYRKHSLIVFFLWLERHFKDAVRAVYAVRVNFSFHWSKWRVCFIDQKYGFHFLTQMFFWSLLRESWSNLLFVPLQSFETQISFEHNIFKIAFSLPYFIAIS